MRIKTAIFAFAVGSTALLLNERALATVVGTEWR